MYDPHPHDCSACGRAWSHANPECLQEENDRQIGFRAGGFFGLCKRCRRHRHLYYPLFLEMADGAWRPRTGQEIMSGGGEIPGWSVAAEAPLSEEQRFGLLRGWALEVRRKHRKDVIAATVVSISMSASFTGVALMIGLPAAVIVALVVGYLVRLILSELLAD